MVSSFRCLRFVAPLLCAALWISGCGPTQEQIANGDDPLRALESTVASTKYGAAFWAEEFQSASEKWNDAVEKCGDPKWSSTPNCLIVREQLAEAETAGDEGESGDQLREEIAPDDSSRSESSADEEDPESADKEEGSEDEERPSDPNEPAGAESGDEEPGTRSPGQGT